MNPPPVTIGVAVRFEAPDVLRSFVDLLVNAARSLDTIAESEVIFCLNGSKEATADFLQSQARALHHPDLPIRCIESSPGKIAAQRAIAKERKLHGHLLFVDADVVFEPMLFHLLYTALHANPSAQVAYAEVEALPSVARGLLRRFQDAYYPNRYRLSRRRHLHGRCFLLRDWLLEFEWDVVQAPVESEAWTHLSLARGPLVDMGIYVTRACSCIVSDQLPFFRHRARWCASSRPIHGQSSTVTHFARNSNWSGLLTCIRSQSPSNARCFPANPGAHDACVPCSLLGLRRRPISRSRP